MEITGIAWHAVVVEVGQLGKTRRFFDELLGRSPEVDAEGVAAFRAPDGSVLELFTPETVLAYGFNDNTSLTLGGCGGIDSSCEEGAGAASAIGQAATLHEFARM